MSGERHLRALNYHPEAKYRLGRMTPQSVLAANVYIGLEGKKVPLKSSHYLTGRL